MIATFLALTLLATGSANGPRLKAAPAPAAKTRPATAPHKTKAKSKPKPKPTAPAQSTEPADDGNVPVADPLAQAAGGKMQCYAPDTVKRTCASLAEYSDNGDGTWNNISSVMISSEPFAVLKTITPVAVKDSAICGYIKPEDIAAGTLVVDGRLLDADEAKPILAKIGTAMSFLYDHEICTRYYPNGHDYTARVTLDGEPNGQSDNEVLWVGAKDGYGITP